MPELTKRLKNKPWPKGLLTRCRLALLVLSGLWLAMTLLWQAVPLPAGLGHEPRWGIELLDRDGRSLREVPADGYVWGQSAALADVPEVLLQATVVAEDQRFWKHSGVDWRATARAALSLLRNGRIVSGGSTISQQLIKLTEPRPRTFRTKLIEAIQAKRLEQLWSKEKILHEYLRRLDYGNGRFGCAAAARYYFGKPARDLTAAQAALLAGLPQGPTRLNPHVHPKRAQRRQAWILGRLCAQGYLARADYARALGEPLRLAPPRRSFQAPHFVDLVLQQHPRLVTERMGRSIGTTLDLSLNQFAEKLLREQLVRLHPQNVRNGAIVVLENRTGDVLALVGSENYFAPDAGQVNGAWAARSAGSTFKPFTYLLAFEQGANPASVVADVPTEFPTPTGIFSPANYDHRYYGPMRYRLALANSLNVSAVKVLLRAGGPSVLRRRLEAWGMTTLTQPDDHYGLGLTIGNAETRLIELANAYACLARLGRYRPYRLVRDGASSLPSNPSQEHSLTSPQAAYLIADILGDNQARTAAFGADSSLRFEFPVACKTGTSTDFRDNWAVGYTPEFTVAVWMGNFDGTPMQHTSGVTGAAPILHELFVHLHQNWGTSWFSVPSGIVQFPIHPVTGKRLRIFHLQSCQERFLSNSIPDLEDPSDYDPQGRVRLSAEYRGWLSTGDNWLGRNAVAQAITPPVLQVLAPLSGATYFLDPDLPDQGSRLHLLAQGGQNLRWRSDSLAITRENGETYAWLTEGRHTLSLVDITSGQQLQTAIQVRLR